MHFQGPTELSQKSVEFDQFDQVEGNGPLDAILNAATMVMGSCEARHPKGGLSAKTSVSLGLLFQGVLAPNS